MIALNGLKYLAAIVALGWPHEPVALAEETGHLAGAAESEHTLVSDAIESWVLTQQLGRVFVGREEANIFSDV